MAKNTVNKDKEADTFFGETPSQRILLEEFRLLQSRFASLRDEGTARMNFFITASSVALGGVLVFGSGNTNMPTTYFKIALLITLLILAIIGIGIYRMFIYRDIATDRYERGLARIRHYFEELDPKLVGYFVSRDTDLPTNYLIWKNSAMRQSLQVIVGFFLGLVVTLLLTLFISALEVYISIGCIIAILVYIFLEVKAVRDLTKALKSVEADVKFKEKVNAKK